MHCEGRPKDVHEPVLLMHLSVCRVKSQPMGVSPSQPRVHHSRCSTCMLTSALLPARRQLADAALQRALLEAEARLRTVERRRPRETAQLPQVKLPAAKMQRKAAGASVQSPAAALSSDPWRLPPGLAGAAPPPTIPATLPAAFTAASGMQQVEFVD